MGDPSAPLVIDVADQRAADAILLQAIQDAGWAPFHFDRKRDGIAEPWRVYILPQGICRQIAKELSGWFPEMKPGNKMPSLLSACGAVALVTWIPQSPEEIPDPTKLQEINREHLAASAAMVQNLLLLLEAAAFGTYWGSGGFFTDSRMFARLGIPLSEQLLAAVYIEYPSTRSLPLERVPGGNRDRRTPASAWCRTVAR
jgi:hypothetical protein